MSGTGGVEDAEWARLSHGTLDGNLSTEDGVRLSELLVTSNDRATQFARLALLHDAIERELNAAVELRAVARRMHVGTQWRVAVATAAVLVVAAGLAWFGYRATPSASAAEVVARLVTMMHTGDRTYLVRAVESGRNQGRSSERSRDWRDVHTKRGARPQPSIDGAILHLRAARNYVLVRVDETGSQVVSGSDGTRAWSIPSIGPVRVSADPKRFSGALPGSQHGIAFIDPHLDLAELSQSYDLSLVPATKHNELARIEGVRRGDARGGPRRIVLTYDDATALIHLIRLENLPQARGGPRTVEFELVDDAPLDDDFFLHTSHHDASRVIIEES